MKKRIGLVIILILTALPLFATGAEGGESITHRMTLLVIQVGIILFAAKLGGKIMKLIKMPAVLGELLIGVVIGPFLLGGITLPGFPHGLFPVFSETFAISPELYSLATIASIILLFLSGLETDLEMFLTFSLKGVVIGVGGVVVSFLVGAWSGSIMMGTPLFAPINLFLGVLSIATSVGITARILSDMKKMDSPEGVTILAAAVIDDVLGIIILAIVIGVIGVMGHGGSVEWKAIGGIALKAVGVWLGFTALGLIFSRKISALLKGFKGPTSIAVMSLGIALLVAGFFEEAGLAMIIGAYVMGLSLSRTDISFLVQEKLHSVQEFFVPIFFCVMGMMVDINVFTSKNVLIFGLVYSVFAIISKIVGCSIPSLFLNFNPLGALRVGMGMVPRGEVALIIAGIGISTGILNQEIFGVAVMMTLITTLLPPPLLTSLLKKKKRGTKTELARGDSVTTEFDFPTTELLEFSIIKVRQALKNEGFYLHSGDFGPNVYQIRKDEISFTLYGHPEDNKMSFASSALDVPYIKTVVYETLVEVHETVNRLKEVAKPDEMRKDLNASTGRVRNEFFNDISPSHLTVDLRGETKDEIIENLVDILDSAGALNDRDEVLKVIKEREEVMSTGMQNGVALPHGRAEGVDKLVAAIGIKKDGMDFQSLDGKKSKIFVLAVSPKNAPESHIQFLASVSTIMNRKESRDILLKAKTSEEFRELLIKEAKKY